MNVILFGASGMIGQGVLRECLQDARIQRVLVVTRSSLARTDPKLHEIVHRDFGDFTAIREAFTGYDACFWCLGVSSAGMSEPDYTRVTYDYAIAAAKVMLEANPDMTMCFVSGGGTDSSEKGSSMWARVKGKTENALLAMPFRSAIMFRPGFVQPQHGIVSRTTMYRVTYVILRPFVPIIRVLFPGVVSTSDQIAKAMIHAALHGAPKKVLEVTDINALATQAAHVDA